MPMSEFDPAALPDPQGKQVVFACRSGNRSVTASLAAQTAGLPYNAHLAGGIKAWKEAGLPTESVIAAPSRVMNSVFADLPVSVFEVMSRLAREQDAVNLGQGFPDDPGRRTCGEGRGSGRQRLEPVSADDGPAGTAPGRRGALQALAGPRPRSRQRDHDHVRRDRGDRRRPDGADRAGRRGGAVPADVRCLSAAGAAGRRRAALRAARAAALALRRGDAGARVLAEDKGRAVQQSAQSGGHRVSARGSRTAGALLREIRRHRGVRRGVGARHVRRTSPHSADRDAGHARALRQDRLGRKDFLAHRVEGRTRLRRA